MENMWVIWILAAMGVFTFIFGIWSLAFGVKFKNNALETKAEVEDCIKDKSVSYDSKGNRDVDTNYYLILRFDTPDLPSTVRIETSGSEFRGVLKGSSVTVYYLPHDTKHITLRKNHWFKQGLWALFASVWVFGFCAVFFFGAK